MNKEKIVASIAIFVLFISIIFVLYKKNKDINYIQPDIKINDEQEKPEEKPKIEDKEPNFKDYKPIRNSNNIELGSVLNDIESHMPEKHIYRDNDKITWGHETTHGINSNLRLEFSKTSVVLSDNTIKEIKYLGGMINDIHGKPVFKSFAGINAFYLTNDKIIVLNEPNTTVAEIAKNVPQSLKGGVYNLYLINQAKYWNDTPLYIFDEWSAYVNGSLVRLDLSIKERSETVLYMLEFNVYAICIPMITEVDEEVKNYLKWNIKRSMKIYQDSKKLGNYEKQDEYLNKMQNAPDAEDFRKFARNYFGSEWTKDNLNF